jgi:hypothetical protein
LEYVVSRILTDWESFLMAVPMDDWLDMKEEPDQCDAGPCGDDPDCPCVKPPSTPD